MLRRQLPAYCLSLVFTICLSGCGWFGFGDEDSEEFLEAMAPDEAVEQQLPTPAEGTLKLNVTVGQRFPLLKTVEQSLTQKSGQLVVTGTSKLELLLSLEVEEIRAGRTRFGVRYQRVRYSHDIAGDRVTYDSGSPRFPLPLAAQPYQGLVGNSFSFWVGSNHRVVELVGFEDFLQRCVNHVPVAQRKMVLTKLAETTGEEGIANFVDDSIGLLPQTVGDSQVDRVVKEGDTWVSKRQIVRPLPMYVNDTCTLKELNERFAEIEIAGSITPSAIYGPSGQANSNVDITIHGGHSFGSCTIDRNTGLPIRSRIERYLDMNVQLADGRKFDQHKKIVTTISTFPQQQASGNTVSTASGTIQQTSAHKASLNESQRINNAAFGSESR